jgi:hypothetical protein
MKQPLRASRYCPKIADVSRREFPRLETIAESCAAGCDLESTSVTNIRQGRETKYREIRRARALEGEP